MIIESEYFRKEWKRIISYPEQKAIRSTSSFFISCELCLSINIKIFEENDDKYSKLWDEDVKFNFKIIIK